MHNLILNALAWWIMSDQAYSVSLIEISYSNVGGVF